MLALMNHSIDLMEAFANECGNVFRMNRRGYLYVAADENKIADMENASRVISSRGAGKLRVHSSEASAYLKSHAEGFADSSDGADLLISNELIRKHFPYLTERAVGWLRCTSDARVGWARNSWACTSSKWGAGKESGLNPHA